MFKKIPLWAWIVLLIVIIAVCMRQGTEYNLVGTILNTVTNSIAEQNVDCSSGTCVPPASEQAAAPVAATKYPYSASTTYPGLSDDNYVNYCTSGKENGFCSDGYFANTSCVKQCATPVEAASDAETTPDGCPKCVC